MTEWRLQCALQVDELALGGEEEVQCVDRMTVVIDQGRGQ